VKAWAEEVAALALARSLAAELTLAAVEEVEVDGRHDHDQLLASVSSMTAVAVVLVEAMVPSAVVDSLGKEDTSLAAYQGAFQDIHMEMHGAGIVPWASRKPSWRRQGAVRPWSCGCLDHDHLEHVVGVRRVDRRSPK
jgi:hypothetical protein